MFLLCPSCKQDGFETQLNEGHIYEDRNIAKLMDSLSVKCKETPCQWKGMLAQYDTHQCPQTKTVNVNPGECSHQAPSKNVNVPSETETMEGIEHSSDKASNLRSALSINELMTELHNLIKANSENSVKIEIANQKIEVFEGVSAIVISTGEKILKHCEEVNTICVRQAKEIDDLKATLATVRNESRLMRHELDHRVISMDGTITWPLTEVTEKRQLAVNGTVNYWVSPPFQTSSSGYRMQLKIYLNGDGSGKHKYISLFFIILKSAFDNILSWPFQQKVKFMALDQSGRGKHIVDAFRPDLSSSSFQKPIAEANIATGCPLFMPLSVLEGNGGHDSGIYVKDDTMFIKATVDVSGLQN